MSLNNNEDVNIIISNWTLPELVVQVDNLVKTGQSDKGILVYQAWLTYNGAHTGCFAVYFNLAALFDSVGQFERAAQAYSISLGLKPQFFQSRLNLGSLFEKKGLYQQALAQWAIVVEMTEDISAFSKQDLEYRAMALNHLGRVSEGIKSLTEAEDYYLKSLDLDITQKPVLYHLIGVRQKQCKWPLMAFLPQISITEKWRNVGALMNLGLTDDPLKQLNAAKNFVEDKYLLEVDKPLCKKTDRYEHEKIRVGYLSSDIRNHAVSFLTVPLFELYDREQFEVYVFSWSVADGSEVRQRILDGCTEYVPIGSLSDEEAAKQIKAREIDILVDLQGLTSGARPNILIYRPAPISVSYLGYPASSAHPALDYIVGDKYLIPEEYKPYYSEKPLYLEPVYQVSDDKRPVASIKQRADFGLPQEGFVFCSFNNNYKFNPEMFLTWLNILKQVPNSVLWLLADNEVAKQNMLNFARLHSVAQSRLIFAKRVLPADYLAQYALADCFLDTFPFNAGTTASDALWMDLPILTLSGMSFASRMAGAFLSALSLPELIADSYQDYEQKAVELASSPKFYQEIKARLVEGKKQSGMMDSQLIVNNIYKLFNNVQSKAIPN